MSIAKGGGRQQAVGTGTRRWILIQAGWHGGLQVASYLDKTLTKCPELMYPRPNSLLSERDVGSMTNQRHLLVRGRGGLTSSAALIVQRNPIFFLLRQPQKAEFEAYGMDGSSC